MNSERSEGVEGRAAKHAALADPARLAIVDALSLGDASPTELQAELGISSNLLAHHLNVLAGVGMLTRTRSEADRRRTYLHLVPDALDRIVPGSRLTASRVLFVCTANTARSQLAAALWRRASPVPAVSAGTHPGERIAPGAIEAAHRHDMALSRSRPRAIADVRTTDDLVITVCDQAHEELAGQHTAGPSRPGLHWSVPDPVRVDTPAAFDQAFDDLTRRVGELAARLSAA